MLEKVFGAVSFAHEDTHTPMFAALAGLATAIAGGVLLFPRFGHVGVAGAIAISGWVGAGLLSIILYRRRWLRLDADARRRLPRIVHRHDHYGRRYLLRQYVLGPARPASSLGRLAILAALVIAGVATYLASLQLLGVVKLEELAVALRRKS